ncbi:GNAT family N-acetyltransferase [Brevibacillus brevis]|uniref:GNAT family N-acetyltransferase n=1 Tax=Brevibacillus brevis TaxID=1393 RepID=UPI000D109EA1|nr:N-acetyltransferase [Brevibacillus brevis]PSJ67357.1 GNAT family N-acetyltransferase [Brevibacillus brevis]RED28329.1 putative N-acetyltransferase YhbS [Brevibacillus brevis]GEC93613.1 N-acetyltransferase [Brevibacillus brevis]VEF91024.1 Predicted acetyltransferase [Brevibacillus brevis]
MDMRIRVEQVDDYSVTEQVVKNAFANAEFTDHKEHELVSRIRKSDAFIPALSLVAIDEENQKIVGHILLSKINIRNDNQSIESLALAPVSVLPDHQSKGIGKKLILEALQKAKELGYQSVVVLGHPGYYPKFGFQKASRWGIKAPFEVPDEVFMALELRENALANVSGVVEYSRAFFE